MVYVSAQVKQILLSQTACKGLCLMTKDFTKVTVQPQVAKCTATKNDKDDDLGCNCPTRVEALDPPRFRRNASPAELEDTIRKHFASSAFNTCNKRKLPIMQVQPCERFVNTNARPFTIYNYRPFTIYWEKDLKQGLERDTDIGIIWSKLMGEPTIWCAPKHIIAKKTSKPKSVVNF